MEKEVWEYSKFVSSSMFNRLYRAKSCLPRFASGDFAEELCMKLVETCSHYYLAKDQKSSRWKFNKLKQQLRAGRVRIYFRDFHRK